MKKLILSLAVIFTATMILNAEEAKKEDTTKKVTKSAKEIMADLSADDEETITGAADQAGDQQLKETIPQLTNLLKNDKRIKVRLYSAIALGLIGDVSASETLNTSLTSDQSADVRYAVLLAIHRIDPGKSVDALKKLNETETDPFIRDYIEKMLAKIKGK
jgi:HEAT repeat protein